MDEHPTDHPLVDRATRGNHERLAHLRERLAIDDDAAAHRIFDSGKPDTVVVTDSVALGERFAGYLKGSLIVLTMAPIFAEAIRRLESGGSVSQLGGL